MVEFTLRPARSEDLEKLFEVHRGALGEYVKATWGWDEDWQWRYFQDHFDCDNRQTIVFGEQIIGFLDVHRRVDHVELTNIEIAPKLQSQGIGSAIIQRVIEDARNDKLPVRLQVLKHNMRAQSLYRRIGFCACGETETHVLMKFCH